MTRKRNAPLAIMGFIAILILLVPAVACATTWEVFKSRFIQADGRVIDPIQNRISHSEGQGYGLLLAVIHDDSRTFEAIRRWTADNLTIRRDGLSAWSWGRRPNGEWDIIDYNNATDGDVLIAYALLLAHDKWQHPGDLEDALRIIATLRRKLSVDAGGETYLLPGYYGFSKPEGTILNPGYFVFPAYEKFAGVDDRAFWERVRESARKLIGGTAQTRFRLSPDWVQLGGGGPAIYDTRSENFGYEAIRVPLYLAMSRDRDLVAPYREYLLMAERFGYLPLWVNLVDGGIAIDDAPGGFLCRFRPLRGPDRGKRDRPVPRPPGRRKNRGGDWRLLFERSLSARDRGRHPMSRFFLFMAICAGLLAATAPGAASGGVAEAWKLYNDGRLASAGRIFESLVERNTGPKADEARLGLAYVRRREKNFPAARAALTPLAEKGFRPLETIPLMVDVLLSQGDIVAARGWARRLPAEAQPAMTRRFIAFYETRLRDLTAGDSNGRSSAAAAILELDPGHVPALETLAWLHYDAREYDRAEALFTRILAQNPRHRGAALGLGYTRLNDGRADTALDAIDRAGLAEDPEIRKLRGYVYRKAGAAAYADGRFERAAGYLERALALDPEDVETNRFLAWARFKAAPSEDTLRAFEAQYGKAPDAETAGQLLDAVGVLDDPWVEDRVLSDLAGSTAPAVRRLAADRLFQSGQPARAALADPGAVSACYGGADRPGFAAGYYFRHREGDPGTSRLDDSAFFAGLDGAAADRWAWSLKLLGEKLDSGDAPAAPFVGAVYRKADGVVGDRLKTSDTVISPRIDLTREGPLMLDLMLGTTPLDATISPTATGLLRIGTPRWHLRLHRLGLRESILSYGGLPDPYGRDAWGRVVRNGISAGYNHALAGGWWLSGQAGYDRYDGRNTWDNDAAALNLAAGRTLDIGGSELSSGVFAAARHFRRNTNFFTYGHGGYYSPQLMSVMGPFVRLRSPLCEDYLYDVRASAGWLHEETDDSPFYPLLDENDVSRASLDAKGDATRDATGGRYLGETADKVAVSLWAEGWKKMDDHWAVGVFGGMENSSGYLEWSAGIGIRLQTAPLSGFWRHVETLGDYSPYPVP